MTDKKTNNENPADKQQSAANNTNKQGQANAKAQAPKPAADKKPAPEQKPAAEKQVQSRASAASQPSEKQGGSKTGAIAIALVIALGAGLYYHGHQQTQTQNGQMAALKQEISQLQSQLQSSLKTSQQETLNQVNSSLQRTETSIEQQDKSITGLQMALAEMKGRRPNDWLLAEADYLVKMAGRKLWLEHDTVSATILLESADHRIAELNDPSLTPIRQAMHTDITALKAVARVDRDGLVLRLTSLQEEIGKLPLANAILPEAGSGRDHRSLSIGGRLETEPEDLAEKLQRPLHHLPPA